MDNYRIVKYHGRIDDRFGYTYKNAKASRRDLYEAIKEQHADKSISVATTKPLGCLITHNPEPEEAEEITYAKHISRIVQDRCQNCHRPDAIAPFALMDYDDVRDFSEMIREVVVQRRMPPWHADPRYGHFATDRSLSKEQLNTLFHGSMPVRRSATKRICRRIKNTTKAGTLANRISFSNFRRNKRFPPMG